MSIVDLKAELQSTKAKLQLALDEVKAVGAKLVSEFQNTDKPLGERWALFIELAQIPGVLPEKPWICHSIDDLRLEWYDDFYYERHETVGYHDVDEKMVEFLEEGRITQKQYDTWREKILAAGNGSFDYDW